jgi:hypothetical protein
MPVVLALVSMGTIIFFWGGERSVNSLRNIFKNWLHILQQGNNDGKRSGQDRQWTGQGMGFPGSGQGSSGVVLLWFLSICELDGVTALARPLRAC